MKEYDQAIQYSKTYYQSVVDLIQKWNIKINIDHIPEHKLNLLRCEEANDGKSVFTKYKKR